MTHPAPPRPHRVTAARRQRWRRGDGRVIKLLWLPITGVLLWDGRVRVCVCVCVWCCSSLTLHIVTLCMHCLFVIRKSWIIIISSSSSVKHNLMYTHTHIHTRTHIHAKKKKKEKRYIQRSTPFTTIHSITIRLKPPSLRPTPPCLLIRSTLNSTIENNKNK